MTMIGVTVVAIMMLLRIHALYYSRRWVTYCVAAFLVLQTAVMAWLLTHGEAVVHNPTSGIQACTMIFDPDISILASSSAWMPLLYDTTIMGLTLYKTVPVLRHRSVSFVMRRLLEDGLIYYTAIFTVTGVLTIMIIAAPPGLKNITAQLELLLTVTMMSRITLNLRRSARKATEDGIVFPTIPANACDVRDEGATSIPLNRMGMQRPAEDVIVRSVGNIQAGETERPYRLPPSW
ncbi:putative expressed protein [Lyophyllum shimeji]|uniref:Expressed protein n=1 Tax=Lyophyllum shimeji TaxID=47721 RepID=A0A9P3UKK0_LYOSH|nr:putative expressed protein [Lyophyllum shimeji]